MYVIWPPGSNVPSFIWGVLTIEALDRLHVEVNCTCSWPHRPVELNRQEVKGPLCHLLHLVSQFAALSSAELVPLWMIYHLTRVNFVSAGCLSEKNLKRDDTTGSGSVPLKFGGGAKWYLGPGPRGWLNEVRPARGQIEVNKLVAHLVSGQN